MRLCHRRELHDYTDYTLPLIKSDTDLLAESGEEDKKQDFAFLKKEDAYTPDLDLTPKQAMVLRFTLPSACYATML